MAWCSAIYFTQQLLMKPKHGGCCLLFACTEAYSFLLIAECTIPEVQNGNVTFHKPGEKVPHGKIVQYHCKDGFQKEHEDSLVCQNGTFTLDGNVTDLPKCTPSKSFSTTICITT